MKDTFSNRLNAAISIRNIKPVELAEMTKISKARISQYMNGIYEAKQSGIYQLAKALDVNEAWLMGYDVPMQRIENYQTSKLDTQYKPPHRIPIIGRVSAGLPLLAEENIIGYTYTERNGGAIYFGLLVSGDSMNATTIIDGSIVIVRKQEDIDDGQIAVVMVDHEEATVKRFYRQGDIVTLMPQSQNPEHKPQMYNLRDIDIRIIGKVVEIKNDIE